MRRKYDPLTGDDVTDSEDAAGEFVTTGYVFEVADERVELEREPDYEGTPAAHGFGTALASIAEPEFIQSLVQVKCLIDRIGGQAFFKAYLREGEFAGTLVHYEHLVKDHAEPSASLSDPILLNGTGPHREVTPSAAPPVEPDQEAADSPAPEPEAVA